MAKRLWAQQEEMWLINNAASHSPLLLTHEFNNAFGGDPRSVDSIRKKIQNLNLKVGQANTSMRSVIDMDEWKQLSRLTYPNPPKRSLRKVTTRKNFKSYLILEDVHNPNEHKKSISAILQLMDDIAFGGLVILGDFMDMESFSHWNINKRLSIF